MTQQLCSILLHRGRSTLISYSVASLTDLASAPHIACATVQLRYTLNCHLRVPRKNLRMVRCQVFCVDGGGAMEFPEVTLLTQVSSAACAVRRPPFPILGSPLKRWQAAQTASVELCIGGVELYVGATLPPKWSCVTPGAAYFFWYSFQVLQRVLLTRTGYPVPVLFRAHGCSRYCSAAFCACGGSRSSSIRYVRHLGNIS